jgi:uncharacterized protein
VNESSPPPPLPPPGAEPSPVQPPPPAWPGAPAPAGGPKLPQTPWGPARALGGLAALLLVTGIWALLISAFDPDLDSLGATLALQALLAATLIGVAFVIAQPAGGLADPALFGLRRPTQPVIKDTVLAYLAYIGCALVIYALLQPEQEDVARELGFDEGVLGSLAAGFLIVVAAPISEEVFFRGFLFRGLSRALPFAGAAVVSAGVWGLFHFTGADSWGVVVQLAVFGVILAWLYERTGSLWPPIAVHAFNNALAFAILAS